MLDFATHTQIVRTLPTVGAERLDLMLLERQTRALEAIAAQLRSVSKSDFGELRPELQPQYALARKRHLEEPV